MKNAKEKKDKGWGIKRIKNVELRGEKTEDRNKK